jgi:hypothetical protein
MLYSRATHSLEYRKVITKTLLFVFALPFACLGQGPAGNQTATNAVCSNTKITAKGNVVFKCSGLSPAEQEVVSQLPSLLQKILGSERADTIKVLGKLDQILLNQKNIPALIERLDQLLSGSNPNQPIKTYFCNGTWRTAGPSATAAFDIERGGDASSSTQMANLANTDKWAELVGLSKTQQDLMPGWLTPFLLRALAEWHLKDVDAAKKDFLHYEQNKGPAYDQEGCRQIEAFLMPLLGHSAE